MQLVSRVGRWRRNVFYGWWILLAGVVVNFFGLSLHSFGFANFFLPLTKDLGLSRARTSLVYSATRLESGAEGPIVGWAIDKFGPRPIMLAAVALAVVGYVLLGTVVHSFWTLFVVYVFVISLGTTGGFFPPVSTAFNHWFVRRRGVANGSLNAAFRLAGFIWAPLVAYLVLHVGWRTTAIAMAAIMLVTLLPMGFILRRSPESMGLLPDGDKPGGDPSPRAAAAGSMRRSIRSSVDFTARQALRTPTFWLYALAMMLRNLANGAIMVHMIPMLVWKGLSPQEAANLFGITALVAAPLSLVWGSLGDRWPAHRVFGASVAFSLAGLAILTWSSTHWHLYLFVLCWGISDGSLSLMMTITGNFFGRKSFATLRGIQGALFAFGGFATPVFAGWVFDKTDSYLWALIPSVVATAVALPLFFILRQPRLPAPKRAPVAPESGVRQ